MELPLQGVRVLDLTRFLAGPFSTMLLAEMGATVVKVEKQGRGDETRYLPPLRAGVSHYFDSVNRGKQSVEVDFSSDAGRRMLQALVDGADVLIDNFRPGVMEALGLAYGQLKAGHPRLVCCSISGFGTAGPLRDRAAFDLAMQGETGIMATNGERGGPPMKLGLPAGDMSVGMDAVQGILAALVRREATGQGGQVEVNLFDSLLSWALPHVQAYFLCGKAAPRMGSGREDAVPFGVYASADGYVALAGDEDAHWRILVYTLASPALATDERFSTAAARLLHRGECEAAVAALCSGWRAQALVDALNGAGYPCGVVRELNAGLESEHAKARGVIGEVDHPRAGKLRGVRMPVRFDGRMCELRVSPALGEHTRSVLDELSTHKPDESAG